MYSVSRIDLDDHHQSHHQLKKKRGRRWCYAMHVKEGMTPWEISRSGKTISTWSSKQIWIERQNFVTFVTHKRADEYRIEERSFFIFFCLKKGGYFLSVGFSWTMFDNVQVSQTNFIACRCTYIWERPIYATSWNVAREIVSKERPPPFFFFCSSASWYTNIFTTLCT